MNLFKSTLLENLVWPRLPLVKQVPAMLTLLFGVTLSLMMYSQAKTFEAERCRLTFDRDAEVGVSSLERGLASFVGDLQHRVQLFAYESVHNPGDPDAQFRMFASGRTDDLSAVRWVVRFDANGGLEQAVRGNVAAESESFVGMRVPQPGRLTEQARTNGIAVSEPFRVGEVDSSFAVLMMVPRPKIVDGRISSELEGYIGCVVGLKDLMLGMKPEGQDLEYVLSDEEAQGSAGYRLDLAELTEGMGYGEAIRQRINGLRARGTLTFELPVGGRTLSVLVAPTLHYLYRLESPWPSWVLTASILLSVVLSDYVLRLMVKFTYVERQARDHAAALAGANCELAHQMTLGSNASEEVSKLTLAMDYSPVGVVMTRPDGLVEYVNKQCMEMTGYDRAELIGRHSRLMEEERLDMETFLAIQQQLAEGKIWRGEITDMRKDGRLIDFDMSIAPVVNHDGETTNLVIVCIDVTDRKRLERQFLQAQKMEVIGRLAGGVVHDLSNMLTVILGTSQIVKSQLPGDDPLVEDIDQIIRVSTQAGAMNRHLLAFARTRSCEAEVVNVNDVLRETDRFLVRTLGEDVVLKSISDDPCACIKIDPGQFSQLVMNLVVNARDAMPDGGELIIKTRTADLSPALCSMFHLTPGEYVMLSVRDSGIGMTEQVRRHLFEPFFTTKAIDKGTGLGLSTVYGIVKQFGGAIDVESELGKGSEFKVYFAKCNGAAGQEITPEKSEVPRGSETLLLVEDDGDVRQLSITLLRGLGYKVVAAEHARQALDFALRGIHSFALLVTDVVMPEINGVELVVRLRKVRPDLKVIFTTGFGEHPLLNSDMPPDNTWMLRKPFTRESLGCILRTALDAPLDEARSISAVTPQADPGTAPRERCCGGPKPGEDWWAVQDSNL